MKLPARDERCMRLMYGREVRREGAHSIVLERKKECRLDGDASSAGGEPECRVRPVYYVHSVNERQLNPRESARRRRHRNRGALNAPDELLVLEAGDDHRTSG